MSPGRDPAKACFLVVFDTSRILLGSHASSYAEFSSFNSTSIGGHVMTREQFNKRQERALRETFIIKKTDEGHRVYAPGDPARNYLVAGSVDQPTCTCPDFEHHSQDPDWRCKHILAVLNRANGTEREPEDHVER